MLEATLKAYIHETIEVEKAGLKVKYKTAAKYNMPEEFINKLEEVPGLQDAFEALTPERQKAYPYYFSDPNFLKPGMSASRNMCRKFSMGRE